MTAPVLVESSTDGVAGWKTRFIMPAKWTAETLPAPGREIFINDIPPRTIAAIRFSGRADDILRSEEHTSELQSLMRISYAVFCLKKKKHNKSTKIMR